jgi:hypothetical protein
MSADQECWDVSPIRKRKQINDSWTNWCFHPKVNGPYARLLEMAW